MALSSTAKGRLLGAALAALCAVEAPAQAELTPEEARTVAVQARAAGDLFLAGAIAKALLVRDPDDLTAAIILAEAEIGAGRPEAGRVLAQKVLDETEADNARYAAARLIALSHADEGQFTRSQLWLRRAATLAPNEATLAQTRQDFRDVRARNPWQTNVSLSFSPSDNVNDGAAGDELLIEGLPFTGDLTAGAQALSGTSADLNVALRYKLAESAEAQTTLGARTFQRRVWLTDEAEAQAPTFDTDDLAISLFEADVTHRRRVSWGEVFGTLAAGSLTAGSADATGFARLSLGSGVDLGEDTILQARTSFEARAEENGVEGDKIASLETALIHQIADVGTLSFALGLSDRASASGQSRSETRFTELTFAPEAAPMGIDLAFTAGYSWADYPDYTVVLPVPGGRQDETGYLRAEAVLKEFGYGGFAPVLSINLSQTDSNVSRFTNTEQGFGLTMRSTF